MDLTAWTNAQQLAPLVKALQMNDRAAAQAVLDKMVAEKASPHLIEVARVQVAAFDQKLRPSPADATEDTLFLSESTPAEAKVGWQKPSYNRLEGEADTPLFQVGAKYFARGIYAHAPARHVYNLGGKWARFSGAAGVADGKGGRVGFKIVADGKEIWKSKPLEGSEIATFDLSVQGVKTLELVTDDGGNGANSDWGLWLDPTLTR